MRGGTSGVYVLGYGDNDKICETLLEHCHIPADIDISTDHISEKSLDDTTMELVKGMFAEMFEMNVNEIDADTDLDEYGLDSVIIQQFNAMILKYIPDVSKTILFECHTINSIVEYLLENYSDMLGKCFNINYKTEKAFSNTDKAVNSDKNELLPADHENDEYAIIGISCRFPGADNADEFWENLKNGKDSLTDVSVRWNMEKYSEETFRCKKGGFINDADKFDAQFFHISDKEAIYTDPQERIMLETAYKAFEDAGLTSQKIDALLREIGVFIGAAASSYHSIAIDNWNKGRYEMPNTRSWSVANRISYTLDLKGESMTVDSACSSSLSALELAVNSIKLKKCRAALVGGINLILHPSEYAIRERMHLLSKEGHCNSFGEKADGYVPGEGAAAIIIRPLNDALRCNDRIYGVIRGIAVGHSGKTNGYTFPDPNSEADVIIKAVNTAGIDLRKISYIEAHGTGTALGDTIEIEGLTKAFERCGASDDICAIGSVKSNIGNTEAVSGIAGIIKVLLQMQHNELAPSLHSEKLNQNIRSEKTPFRIQRTNEKWYSDDNEIRFAGVSSFGAGGTNAHVILSYYPMSAPESFAAKKPYFIAVSSQNITRLRKYAGLLAEYLIKLKGHCDESELLMSLSYTLLNGRDKFPERFAFWTESIDEAVYKLNSFIQSGDKTAGVYTGHAKDTANSLFSGDAGKAFIQELKKDHSEEKLAMLWVIGSPFEWADLEENINVKLISIPSYVFEKKCYWLDGSASTEENTDNESSLLYREEMNGFLELCRDCIGIKELNEEDDLFSVGCNSISVIKLISCIKEKYNKDIDINYIFNDPVIRNIFSMLKNTNESNAVQDDICDTKNTMTCPLSYSQEGIWFDSMTHTGNRNIICFIIHLEGQIDIMKLEKVIDSSVKHFASLRTAIKTDSNHRPYQIICDAPDFTLDYDDISQENDMEELLEAYHNSFVHSEDVFSMEDGYLYRFVLIKTAAHKYQFLCAFHHIISDDISVKLFYKYIQEEYYNITHDNAEDRAFVSKCIKERSFPDKAIKPELPSDDIKLIELNNVPKSDNKYGFTKIYLSGQTTELIRKYCKNYRITENVFLLSIYAKVLSILTGKKNIPIGIAVSKREKNKPDSFGMFVDMSLISVKCDEELRTISSNIQNQIINILKNDSIPFSKAAEIIGMPHELRRLPLHFTYNYLYDLKQPLEPKNNIFKGLDYILTEPPHDLGLVVQHEKSRISLLFSYSNHFLSDDFLNETARSFTDIIDNFLDK